MLTFKEFQLSRYPRSSKLNIGVDGNASGRQNLMFVYSGLVSIISHNFDDLFENCEVTCQLKAKVRISKCILEVST